MQRGRDADHHRGVAGEQAGVGAEVAVARRAGGAQADPERQAEQEQHAFLGEQGDQRDHHAEPEQRAEDAVETLRQHLPALRLQDDEGADQHGVRLRQFQPVGQPQRGEGGDQCLADEDPGDPVAACPVG
ncbi:hypothetical protein D3C80_1436000 [compost metagenome]